jgi:membrane-bound lytic murein transglycosylase D
MAQKHFAEKETYSEDVESAEASPDDPDIQPTYTANTLGDSGSKIFIGLKKFVGVFMLSCFFLSVPSLVDHVSQPPKRKIAGPFPIMPMSGAFPFPEELRPQVDFWKKIFTEYTSDQLVIHDDWYLSVIYEVVDVGEGKFASREEGRNAVKAAREKYRQLLETMPWDTPRKMTREQRRVWSLFEDLPEFPRFKKEDAKDRIHIQPGIANTCKSGIIRAGRYIDTMKQIFADHDLPENLAYLPLIESTFNPYARSYVGAMGMWQFMRRTGQQYDLSITDLVDERRDPLLSTKAAARFLKDNYNMLGSWPLAITAYNYGAQGIKNAAEAVGSENIEDIIAQYENRRFQFASRNFYAEFLAARDVCTRYTEYFGDIEPDPPMEIVQVSLPGYVSAETLEKHCQWPVSEIKALNPALDPSVFASGRPLPKDYRLNVPADQKETLLAQYTSIPDELKHTYVQQEARYRVKRGQTLSDIARAHRTSVQAFMQLNGIRNPKRIRPGQLLKIPGRYVSLKAEASKPEKKSKKRNAAGQSAVKAKHRVKRGQTLEIIAKRYKTSPRAIARLNDIKNPRYIRAGQLLKIPEG